MRAGRVRHRRKLHHDDPGRPELRVDPDRFRAECLNAHWFLTLADAGEKLEAWRRYDNEDRRYGAIGNTRPISLGNPPMSRARRRDEAEKLYFRRRRDRCQALTVVTKSCRQTM
jgi:transposase InsO family protein